MHAVGICIRVLSGGFCNRLHDASHWRSSCSGTVSNAQAGSDTFFTQSAHADNLNLCWCITGQPTLDRRQTEQRLDTCILLMLHFLVPAAQASYFDMREQKPLQLCKVMSHASIKPGRSTVKLTLSLCHSVCRPSLLLSELKQNYDTEHTRHRSRRPCGSAAHFPL